MTDHVFNDSIVTEFDVPAQMRDGTTLRANVFRPASGRPYPVALTRTPYGKDFASVSPFLDAVRMARAGYIVVIQDVRGRFRSEGEFSAFRNEFEDGYDTVEWAARLPNANGKVGMVGASYFGFTQWAAAVGAPPSLKAIMPSITWHDTRDGTSWRGGALELGTIAGWNLTSIALDATLKRYAEAPVHEKFAALMMVVGEINRLRTEGYWSLPLKDFEPLQKTGVGVRDLERFIARPYSAEAALATSPGPHLDRVTVPSYNIGGWYDIFLGDTIAAYLAMRAAGAPAKLLIGPWSHSEQGSRVGQRNFGQAAQSGMIDLQTDLYSLELRWFDHWLKGIDTGMMDEPPVKIFVMGANIWRDEAEWPPARAAAVPFYLHANGRLGLDAPEGEEPDHLCVRPRRSGPDAGRRNADDAGVSIGSLRPGRHRGAARCAPLHVGRPGARIGGDGAGAGASMGGVVGFGHRFCGTADRRVPRWAVDQPDGRHRARPLPQCRAGRSAVTDRAGAALSLHYRPVGDKQRVQGRPLHPPANHVEQLPALGSQPEHRPPVGNRRRAGRRAADDSA